MTSTGPAARRVAEWPSGSGRMDETGSPFVVLLFWTGVLAVIGLTGWRLVTSHRSGAPGKVRRAAIMASAVSGVACAWLLVQSAVASHYEMDQPIAYLIAFLSAVAFFGFGYFAWAAFRGTYPWVRSGEKSSEFTSPPDS